MSARLTPQAGADLDEIAGRIRRENPVAADRWFREAQRKIALLGPMPEAGGRLRGSPERRFLLHGRYLILYERTPDGVLVVRVLHGARDRGRLL